MASRFEKKPDPSVKKNVLRARSAARNAKRAHASVVVTSVVATIFAWGMFTGQDAQVREAVQAANSSQPTATVVATVQVSAAQATQPPAQVGVAR